MPSASGRSTSTTAGSHPEEAGPLGPHDPLVRAAGVEVGAGLGDVERDAYRRLRAVEREPDALRLRERRDGLHREQLAGRARHVADEDEARARRDERRDAIDVALAARAVGLEGADDDAVALPAVEERGVEGGVLVRRGDDLVAALERQAADDQVDALGRGRDERQVVFPAARAEQMRQALLDEIPVLRVGAGAGRALLVPRAVGQRVRARAAGMRPGRRSSGRSSRDRGRTANGPGARTPRRRWRLPARGAESRSGRPNASATPDPNGRPATPPAASAAALRNVFLSIGLLQRGRSGRRDSRARHPRCRRLTSASRSAAGRA